MNTERMHKRFWSAMAERYGRRWAEQYGPDSSPAWRELIDRFTPEEVKAALAELPKKAPEFPPTLPQFEAILVSCQQRNKGDTTDWIRGYWRSVIVNEVARVMIERKFISAFAEFEDFLIAHRKTLGMSMKFLLDDVDSREKRTGQRTPGLEMFALKSSRKIGLDWAPPQDWRDQA